MLPTHFSWPNGKRAALSLTFDDARHSQIDAGLPLFLKHQIPATFYVLPDPLRDRLDGWRELVAAGHEIGNHTVTHPCTGNHSFSRHNPLEEYTLERIESEILRADDAIQELLQVRPTTFAYPCGSAYVGRGRDCRSYVPLVAEHFIAARGSGLAPTTDPEICDLAYLPCLNADGVSTVQLIERIDNLLTSGKPHWLILIAHEVGPSGMSSETLNAVCEYAKDHKDTLWADTVANIAAHIAKTRTA